MVTLEAWEGRGGEGKEGEGRGRREESFVARSRHAFTITEIH